MLKVPHGTADLPHGGLDAGCALMNCSTVLAGAMPFRQPAAASACLRAAVLGLRQPLSSTAKVSRRACSSCSAVLRQLGSASTREVLWI